MKGQTSSKVVISFCLIIVAAALIFWGRSLAFLFPLETIPLINYLTVFLVVLSVLILW